MTATATCARGCRTFGAHATACEGDCRGCLPRPADHGKLCYQCHRNLWYALRNSPGQHMLLLATLDQSLTSPAPRDDVSMRSGTSDDMPDAINISRLSAAQELADALSQWVEWLVAELKARGPRRLLTAYQRATPGMLRKISDRNGGHEWVDPPERFEVGSACRWLTAQLEALEATEWIADELGALLDLHARAHYLAPWRAERTDIPGIPCPTCHTATLRIFGGEEDIRCSTCRSMFSPGRYAIWVRMLEAEMEHASAD